MARQYPFSVLWADPARQSSHAPRPYPSRNPLLFVAFTSQKRPELHFQKHEFGRPNVAFVGGSSGHFRPAARSRHAGPRSRHRPKSRLFEAGGYMSLGGCTPSSLGPRPGRSTA
eukprot:704704-Rhodomonas_salina.2